MYNRRIADEKGRHQKIKLTTFHFQLNHNYWHNIKIILMCLNNNVEYILNLYRFNRNEILNFEKKCQLTICQFKSNFIFCLNFQVRHRIRGQLFGCKQKIDHWLGSEFKN